MLIALWCLGWPLLILTAIDLIADLIDRII